MKKIIIFACATLTLSMLSCSGGETKASENAEEVIKQVESTETVIGKWVDAEQKGFELVDDSSVKSINNEPTDLLEWAANEAGDTLSLITEKDTTNYAMSLAGGKLTLTDKDGKATEYTRK